MLPVSRPDLAIHHLKYVREDRMASLYLTNLRVLSNSIAASLAPEDGEIAFNLAVVLESCKFPDDGDHDVNPLNLSC